MLLLRYAPPMSKNTMHSAGMPTTLEQANELIYKLLDRIAELEEIGRASCRERVFRAV